MFEFKLAKGQVFVTALGGLTQPSLFLPTQMIWLLNFFIIVLRRLVHSIVDVIVPGIGGLARMKHLWG